MKHLHSSFAGKVINGVIVLENGAALPEGAGVKVEMLEDLRITTPGEENAEPKAASPLGELLLKFAGIADDLPADMAKNHDHYLYGAPKKAS